VPTVARQRSRPGLEEAENDAEFRAVVLTGTGGRAFAFVERSGPVSTGC